MKELNKMISFVQKEMSTIKKQPLEPNTPRQITNGGKLIAYNKVLVKLELLRSKLYKNS